MMKVAIYIRVSTTEQATEGYSIEAQKERLIAFCKAKGWTITQIYIDPGYSGSNLNRPGVQALIADAKSGKIDAAIVFKLDRLSRSQKDTLHLIEDIFLKNNVDFISMNESFDTSTPFGRAMIGILSVFAQLERENIKERSKMGKRERAKAGLWKGGETPFGYDYKDGKLVPNENSAIVRAVYDMYLAGNGTPTIAKELGIKYDSKVSSYLSSPIYAGKIVWDDEIFDGLHEPIITYDMYLAAQRLTKIRSNKRGSLNINNPLAGLIKCRHCGAAYGKHKGSQNGEKFYYKCYSRALAWNKQKQYMVKDPNCKNRHWRADVLESSVFLIVKERADQGNSFQITDKYNNVNKPDYETQIKQIDSKINKLLDLYLVDNFGFEAVKGKMDELNEKKNVLLEMMKQEQSEAPDEKEVKSVLEDIRTSFDILDNPGKRELMARIIKSIWIDGDKIDIEWFF